MTEDFEKFNKQIAAYVVLSVSLAAPVLSNGSSVANADVIDVVPVAPANIEPLICRYAGPPMVRVNAEPINVEPAVVAPVMRYAGPPNPVMYTDVVPKMPVPADIKNVPSVNQIPAADVNIQMNNMVNNNSINVNNFGGIQLAPGHFIFK